MTWLRGMVLFGSCLLAGCPAEQPAKTEPAKTESQPEPTPAPKVVVFHLRAVDGDPKRAEVFLGEERIGQLSVGPGGKIRLDQGTAVGLPKRGKRFGLRRVEIRAPASLDPALARSVHGLIRQGGASNSVVVTE